MARRNKRGGKANATGRNTSDRFVLLPHYMLRSAAWKTLSPNAKALLIDVWSRHNGANNGDIPYAVREAEEIGLSKDQASRAFKELTERGFLKMRRASTFSLKTKEARTWELTAEGVGDDRGTKDFMRWPENRTQSHQRDGQSHQRDTSAHDERKLPASVAPTRPSRPKRREAQSHQRDTSNIPSGVPLDELIDPPADPPAAHQSEQPTTAPDQQQPTTIEAGRQRHRRPPEPIAGIERDPRQVDLEDLLGSKPSSSSAPVDQLRADLNAYVARSPTGEVKRIAAKLGLSSPQIANFRAGRFGLNSTAAAMLRQYLMEAPHAQ